MYSSFIFTLDFRIYLEHLKSVPYLLYETDKAMPNRMMDSMCLHSRSTHRALFVWCILKREISMSSHHDIYLL